MVIPYCLALAYIDVYVKLKNMIIPSLLFSIVAYVTKITFNAPPIVYTIVITITCAVIIHKMNKVEPLLSFIGSLLSVSTFVLGSLLIACPILIKIGFKIAPNETFGLQWILLNLAEFFIPTLVLIVLKIGKFSPLKNVS
jgi:hypothetical protein